MRGLRRLWTEQLRQLTGGSLEAAQAVATAYPSPQAILQVRYSMGKMTGTMVQSEESVRCISS